MTMACINWRWLRFVRNEARFKLAIFRVSLMQIFSIINNPTLIILTYIHNISVRHYYLLLDNDKDQVPVFINTGIF